MPVVTYDTIIPKVYLDRTKMIIHCIHEHSNAVLNEAYEVTTGFMTVSDAIEFAEKMRSELDCELYTYFHCSINKGMVNRGWKERPSKFESKPITKKKFDWLSLIQSMCLGLSIGTLTGSYICVFVLDWQPNIGILTFSAASIIAWGYCSLLRSWR